MTKHKLKILATLFSTVIAVAFVSLMTTPIYRTSAQLLVKGGREDVYVSPTGSTPALVEYSREGEKVRAEIAILESFDLVIELVDLMGTSRLLNYPDRTLKGRLFKENTEREIPPREKMYRIVSKALDVSSVRNSNVINVSFDWPDPVIATEMVNKLVDLYLAKHLKVHANPQTYSLIKEQAGEWERKLSVSEKKLQDFKLRHSITSLPEQRSLLLGKLAEAESQGERTKMEIQEFLELRAALEGQLSELDQNIELQEREKKRSETLAALKAKLVELELQGLKEEISRVKEMIAEEEKKEQVVVVSGKSPIRQTLGADLLKAKARLQALKAKSEDQRLQIVAYQQDLKSLDSLEIQLKELERNVAINEGNYKLHLSKYEEAKISENMDKQKIANIRIIKPAIVPLRPIKPKKKRDALIGSFLGLLAGIGMAFLVEFLHPVFRTREDVEQFLGLRVLATLPKEKGIGA